MPFVWFRLLTVTFILLVAVFLVTMLITFIAIFSTATLSIL
jgi:hypothetical protein